MKYTLLYILGVAALSTFSSCSSNEDVNTPVRPPINLCVADNKVIAEKIDQTVNSMSNDTSVTSVCVYDITAKEMVYMRNATKMMIPASCIKVLTAVSCLKMFGTGATVSTGLYAKGHIDRGTLFGSLIVKTDDDIMLQDFDSLVANLKAAGVNRIEGNIVYDHARISILKEHPTATPGDIPRSRLPLLCRGKEYVEQTFEDALARHNIQVRFNPVFANMSQHTWESSPLAMFRFPSDLLIANAKLLCSESHTIREMLVPMLTNSSNITAETISHMINRQFYLMYADSECEKQTLYQKHFYDENIMAPSVAEPTIIDGCGLSPKNKMSARQLTRLLKYAYADDSIRNIFINEALASPGDSIRRGSLKGRMSQTTAVGRLFCKTGTLTSNGVCGLEGFLHGNDDHWYIFVILNNNMAVADARVMQDKICLILAQ